MKSNCVKIGGLIAVFGVILSFSSCSKSSEPGLPTVKFSAAQATYNEDQGAINIVVTLSSKSSSDVTVNYSWTTSANYTFLNGDFSLTSPSPITIPAGQTSGNLQVQIIKDTQIDYNDSINFSLIATSANAKLSTTATDLQSVLYINNINTLPANTMQADLVWSTGVDADINKVNLDLFLQYNVTYIVTPSGDSITGFGTALHSSVNTTGFETVQMASTDPDQVYWIAIPYVSGSGAVDFVLTLNGFGWNNAQGPGSFAASDAGTGAVIFLGPFTKSQQTFVFGRTAGLVPKRGKIQVIKAYNFPLHY